MNVLVTYQNGKSEVMEIKKACDEFRLTERQIMNAIESGHLLKTMYFDESLDEGK